MEAVWLGQVFVNEKQQKEVLGGINFKERMPDVEQNAAASSWREGRLNRALPYLPKLLEEQSIQADSSQEIFYEHVFVGGMNA